MRSLPNKRTRTYVLVIFLGLIAAQQAVIITAGALGASIMRETYMGSPELYFDDNLTSLEFQQYLKQQNLLKLAGDTWLTAIKLFCIQAIPLLFYLYCNKKRTKLQIALFIWLGPALLSLPTIAGPFMHFLSLGYAASYLPNLVDNKISNEMLIEGWDAWIAVWGCFHFFWMAIALFNLLRWYGRDRA